MATTFTQFGSGDIVPNIKQTITDAVWSNTSGSLTSFHTSSAQSASTGDYYYDVYHLDPSSSLSEVQFAISYGHRHGSGSTPINDDAGDESLTPSKAIYSQYRNFLLPGASNQFTVGTANTDQIIAINFQRARSAERLDEGNWEFSINTGVGDTYTFIDDSTINTNPDVTEGGTVYNIVSGSIEDGVFNTSSPYYAGLMYPEHSLLILSGDVLRDTHGATMNTGSNVNANNHGIFLDNIRTAAEIDDDFGFKARNEENIRSTYYFCRVRNGDYNYSMNPSFYSGSEAKIRHADMLTNPQTYVTTVGLYNNANELLAVAKLSQPFKKNFHRECVVRVKLDF